MPGSFTDTVPGPSRIPWRPSSEDDLHVSWQVIDFRTLKYKPFQLCPDSIEDIEFDLGRILFEGTQDDHMNLAAVYRREQQLIGRARNGIISKTRSSSTPPATKRFVNKAMEIPNSCSPIGYGWFVHKCPSDFRWGFSKSEYVDTDNIWALCMAGSCGMGRPDNGADIVAAFLPPEKSRMTPREKWLAENFPWEYGHEADLESRSQRE